MTTTSLITRRYLKRLEGESLHSCRMLFDAMTWPARLHDNLHGLG
ncbi:hypothetical protein [Synechococcus sp. UW105]|nr:hypothetical protein [Synechococcus sp. UW105]